MKCIVLFGAGKSSSVLIDYLTQTARYNEWQVIVADREVNLPAETLTQQPHLKTVQLDVYNDGLRESLIQQADVVISLLPPSLHILLAKDCLQYGKHLLTASYVDERIKALEKEIKDRGLLFLCEMGLDPGIDHMSAMQMIHRIQNKDGIIASFKSHCGGLVAPESDDNPWHYKISWNPRNVILAGKAGAVYRENAKDVVVSYQELFTNNQRVEIPGLGYYAWYPNRDSRPYEDLYGLGPAYTFIRTTLRHPEFCFGWQHLIELKLTDETIWYDTDGLSIEDFFKEHFRNQGFDNWLNEMLASRLAYAKEMTTKLADMIEAEQIAKEEGEEQEEVFVVDETGSLSKVNINEEKHKSIESVIDNMYEANLILKQLMYLGLNDDTLINKGRCSAADILQFIIEKKLALQPLDTDMIVMLHEIEYVENDDWRKDSSYLIVKGRDNVRTAMAKTVGLPLGIAAKLLLEGTLTETGLHIPILPSIYEPVLKELAANGIVFTEF